MATAENDDRLLLRLPEVAARLGLGRTTVYDLIQRGDLPVVRVGEQSECQQPPFSAGLSGRPKTMEGPNSSVGRRRHAPCSESEKWAHP